MVCTVLAICSAGLERRGMGSSHSAPPPSSPCCHTAVTVAGPWRGAEGTASWVSSWGGAQNTQNPSLCWQKAHTDSPAPNTDVQQWGFLRLNPVCSVLISGTGVIVLSHHGGPEANGDFPSWSPSCPGRDKEMSTPCTTQLWGLAHGWHFCLPTCAGGKRPSSELPRGSTCLHSAPRGVY